MGGSGPAAPARSKAENAAIPFWADAAVDVGAAAASAICIAPFIMTVDKAVVEAASGKTSLARALFSGMRQLLTRPHVFFSQPSLWMVAGVYGSTYTAANLIDSACERLLDHDDENSSKVHGAAKLVGTTTVNMSAGITKDVMFAKMFGAATAAGPMPKATLGLFALRDFFTIGAAFTLPKQLASLFVATGTVEEKYAGETAQLVSPVAMQVVCSPIHLMALNCFNVRHATVGQRIKEVGKVLPPTTLARMLRMAPAYGVGGVMNTALVHKGRDRNLNEYFIRPRQATEPDDAGPWPPPPPKHRRRIMDTYTGVDAAVELLGDVDSATVEAAGGATMLLRRQSGGGSSTFAPAQAGYYPELADLVEKKLRMEVHRHAHPLGGVLGNSRDVPDVDSDMMQKLQQLNAVADTPGRDGAK